MIRAAMLDIRLYEEVEADRKATGQAVGIIVLSSLAAGIGFGAKGGVGGLVVGTLVALIGRADKQADLASSGRRKTSSLLLAVSISPRSTLRACSRPVP
jgi:hypothetical protein